MYPSDSNPKFKPFEFSGGHYDGDTKYTRFGARDYDPSIGRWLERYPIGFQGGQDNLFVYVNNDPVNGIDPKGNDEFLDPIHFCGAPPARFIAYIYRLSQMNERLKTYRDELSELIAGNKAGFCDKNTNNNSARIQELNSLIGQLKIEINNTSNFIKIMFQQCSFLPLPDNST